MSKLNQDELLEELRQIKIYVQAWKMLNPKKASWSGRREQAYQQIKELILCEDMVQQYRDEMEAEQAETELTYIEIILDLYERIADLCKQLEAKKSVT